MTAGAGRVRHVLSRALRRARGLLERADPSRRALRPLPPDVGVSLACVYRGGNADVVRALLRQLPPGSDVALWCLSGDVPADLAPLTLGAGPGTRFTLLQGLVDALPPSDVLVLTDDDVRFVVGDLGRLVEAGRRLGLDVYQPAHLADSWASFPFLHRRPRTFARVTDFVEQGPLLVLSPAGREVVLPLPTDLGMGWGVEVRWWRAARSRGARLGIVDAVAVRHLIPAARDYDRAESEACLAAEVAAGGLSSVEDLFVVHRSVGPQEVERSRR